MVLIYRQATAIRPDTRSYHPYYLACVRKQIARRLSYVTISCAVVLYLIASVGPQGAGMDIKAGIMYEARAGYKV